MIENENIIDTSVSSLFAHLPKLLHSLGRNAKKKVCLTPAASFSRIPAVFSGVSPSSCQIETLPTSLSRELSTGGAGEGKGITGPGGGDCEEHGVGESVGDKGGGKESGGDRKGTGPEEDC